MIKFMEREKAKIAWDESILKLYNPTYYQSYNYSQICKDDKEIDFIYDTDEFDNIKIMGFVKEYEDKISMPFGPIFSSSMTLEEILIFIDEIKKHYNKEMQFFLPTEYIDDNLVNNYCLKKDWYFSTPLIDTDKSIEEAVRSCNENRRRIIKKVLANIPSENIIDGLNYGDEFIKLYIERMQETEAVVDLDERLLSKILEFPNSKLTICTMDKKLIAGSVTFEFGDTLITRYNCFDSAFSKISPIARIDYELLKYACEKESIKYFDLSGLAEGENISEKEFNLNRYKLSYKPKKKLTYQRYKY